MLPNVFWCRPRSASAFALAHSIGLDLLYVYSPQTWHLKAEERTISSKNQIFAHIPPEVSAAAVIRFSLFSRNNCAFLTHAILFLKFCQLDRRRVMPRVEAILYRPFRHSSRNHSFITLHEDSIPLEHQAWLKKVSLQYALHGIFWWRAVLNTYLVNLKEWFAADLDIGESASSCCFQLISTPVRLPHLVVYS